MVAGYFKSLYQDAMSRAYGSALGFIESAMGPKALLLDCGANNGWLFDRIATNLPIASHQYHGIEWNPRPIEEACKRGLNVIRWDLNKNICHESEKFDCVCALSVLEHLLNPCRFLRECYRVLRREGRLVLLTPNISTYFTALLVLLGKMPSSGPHPDSDELLKSQEVFKVSSECLEPDTQEENPMHRHLVVFSYSVLKKYLTMIGFASVFGYGFGLYPFPKFLQPVLEKIDPFHCHQMVFVAIK